MESTLLEGHAMLVVRESIWAVKAKSGEGKGEFQTFVCGTEGRAKRGSVEWRGGAKRGSVGKGERKLGQWSVRGGRKMALWNGSEEPKLGVERKGERTQGL